MPEETEESSFPACEAGCSTPWSPEHAAEGGSRDDPAHKPASSVDAVRVPHGGRESAGGLSTGHDSSAGVACVGAAGDGGGAGGLERGCSAAAVPAGVFMRGGRPTARSTTVARGIPSASTVTAPLARLMAPVDGRTTIDIGDAPGLSASPVTDRVAGWRWACGVVVPDARSAEGVLSTVQEDACRSK
ncbi:MAG: hypothetical protein QGH15_16260 [Kiritimatiellia bacterium]|nr:hypothetical protein [Kiritimatiellia bacterium]